MRICAHSHDSGQSFRRHMCSDTYVHSHWYGTAGATFPARSRSSRFVSPLGYVPTFFPRSCLSCCLLSTEYWDSLFLLSPLSEPTRHTADRSFQGRACHPLLANLQGVCTECVQGHSFLTGPRPCHPAPLLSGMPFLQVFAFLTLVTVSRTLSLESLSLGGPLSLTAHLHSLYPSIRDPFLIYLFSLTGVWAL